MKKVILLFLASYMLLFADTINFEEERYVASLQKSIFKKGSLEIRDDFIELSYRGEDKIYDFYDDYVILKSSTQEQKYSYDEKMELNLFVKLIRLIYENKKESVDEFFSFKKDGDTILLEPKEQLSRHIQKIEYKKLKNVLVFLKISFKNDEWIKIVQH